MIRLVLGARGRNELLQLVYFIAVLSESLAGNAGLGRYVRRYEEVIVHRNASAGSSGEMELYFSGFGRRFELLLRHNKELFYSGMKVHVVSSSGVEQKDFDSRRYYKGTVKGAANSVVHGYLSEEYGFDGAIHLPEETYHVEPAHRLSPTGHTTSTVVYRLSDVVYNETMTFACSRKKMATVDVQSSVSDCSRLRRAAKSNSDKNTCHIAIVADYEFFNGPGEGSEATTIAEMSYHIQQANTIFRNTEFTDNIKNIGFRIDKTIIYKSLDNPLYGNFEVDELLDTFSELDFHEFCLAHLFTYQDFQNGVIGLAWVGDTSFGSGGVCETQRVDTRNGERSLNTGFTSLLNYQRTVPRAVSSITTAHELGHNFGSLHDEATQQCSPGEFGDSDGNYIMFASATDGSKSNNDQFSPCSKPVMADVISAKGRCFVAENPEPQCGNGVVEGDEECDCGSSNPDTCKAVDPCCKPGNCTLIEGAKCSPVAKACCNMSCEFSTSVCRRQEECIYQTTCNGESGDCPQPAYWEDGKICNNGANTCDEGQCIGSVCAVWNAQSCTCSSQEQFCHVCCLWDDICVSTFDRHEVDNRVNGSLIAPGTACADFKGYCDDSGVCKTVDNQSPLDDLKNFLGSISLDGIAKWLKGNWPYILGGLGVLFLLLILFQVVYRRRVRDEESETLLSDQDRQNSMETSGK